MLVGERMAHPIISVPPSMPINEALHLMRTEHIRRVPVVDDGRLVGIVSMKDLLNASPSPATSLSIWELNYLLSKITIDKVMTRKVFTVAEDTPIEEAARLMADSRVGGLPVMRDSHVVGIITETDLFKIFLELMGARTIGVRISVQMPDTPGQLAKLTHVIAGAGGNIVALGTFAGEDPSQSEVVFKVAGLDVERVRLLVEPVVTHIMDIRVTAP